MAPPVVATLVGLALLKKVVVYSAARVRCLSQLRGRHRVFHAWHGMNMLTLLTRAHHECAWCPECQLAIDLLLPYAGLWDREVLSEDEACCKVGMTGSCLRLHPYMADQASFCSQVALQE